MSYDKIAVGARGQIYFHYGTYKDIQTAERTAWYFKKKSRSKYKIDAIWNGKQKLYRLWLTNIKTRW